ncbi:MAG: ABC transporter permease subunit [Pirellulaceae bacterium]|nr:ABC transporter permease subunit [Pirellulaceae bacterium]
MSTVATKPSGVPAALVDQDVDALARNTARRKRYSRGFYALCVAIALVSVAVLVVLLFSIGWQGHSRLSGDLLKNPHSELSIEQAGMGPAIIGSLFVCGICAAAALPLGVGTAIFLEEFQPSKKWFRWIHGFVNLNIANLAGVPSIVYGLLGLSAFVFMFNVFGKIQVNESTGWEIAGAKHYYQVLSLESGQTVFIPQTDKSEKTIQIESPIVGLDAAGNSIDIAVWTPGTPKPTDKAVRRHTVKKGAVGGSYTEHAWYYFRLPFGKSFLAAGLTLGLVILPIIIIASQEALRGVSPSLREASQGLGATTWQTTRHVTLPSALPGIMTGSILAMGRAIGEAAPILVVLGAAIAKNSGPEHLMDNVVTMPILIYNWAGRQQDTFKELSAAAIIVLLIVLLVLNSVAIYMRQRIQRV